MSDVLICQAMGWTQSQLLSENAPEFIDDLRTLLQKQALVSRQKAAALEGQK